jgi:hypothetical protein
VKTETQNITLALPKALVKKAKVIAAERETSLSALLAGLLKELVTNDEEYDRARQEHMAILARGFSLGTGGKATWTRDELHER